MRKAEGGKHGAGGAGRGHAGSTRPPLTSSRRGSRRRKEAREGRGDAFNTDTHFRFLSGDARAPPPDPAPKAARRRSATSANFVRELRNSSAGDPKAFRGRSVVSGTVRLGFRRGQALSSAVHPLPLGWLTQRLAQAAGARPRLRRPAHLLGRAAGVREPAGLDPLVHRQHRDLPPGARARLRPAALGARPPGAQAVPPLVRARRRRPARARGQGRPPRPPRAPAGRRLPPRAPAARHARGRAGVRGRRPRLSPPRQSQGCPCEDRTETQLAPSRGLRTPPHQDAPCRLHKGLPPSSACLSGRAPPGRGGRLRGLGPATCT
uniref:Transmembrane protein 238 n=1 Tax=Pipistrellus kuhlii TaxID=59472 RepID=A0A7J7QV33_PIPKU|nr:transmembrane protein 238 [Pipistrellus kuhlii]